MILDSSIWECSACGRYANALILGICGRCKAESESIVSTSNEYECGHCGGIFDGDSIFACAFCSMHICEDCRVYDIEACPNCGERKLRDSILDTIQSDSDYIALGKEVDKILEFCMKNYGVHRVWDESLTDDFLIRQYLKRGRPPENKDAIIGKVEWVQVA